MLKVVEPLTPALPMFANPPTSPTATSKLPRFLQSPGKDKERERERQRIREAERRRALDAARVAADLAYIQQGDLTLACSPSRPGADGLPAPPLSGWFAHLAGPGSTSYLSIAATISGCFDSRREHRYRDCACIFHFLQCVAAGKKSKAKSEDSHDASAKSTSKASDKGRSRDQQDVSPRQQLYPADFEPRLLSALIISDTAPELEAARRLQGNCSRCRQVEAEALIAYNRTKIAILTEKFSSVFSGRLSDLTLESQDRKAKSRTITWSSSTTGTRANSMRRTGPNHPQVHLRGDGNNVSYGSIHTGQHHGIFTPSGREVYARKLFKPHFDAKLKTLCAWSTNTSNPNCRHHFLTRTLQETILSNSNAQ
ncbi:hypothetical protein B0H13DRAFT_1898141 [Mycena leptocephala]|nr:hypothetical protein B0H13DRAFT_1898141 [Mycena leptocephala]